MSNKQEVIKHLVDAYSELYHAQSKLLDVNNSKAANTTIMLLDDIRKVLSDCKAMLNKEDS